MTTPDAFEAAKAAATDRPILGTFDYEGEKFEIVKRPNGLILSELSRLDTGDAEALPSIVEFFTLTLGQDGYKKFKAKFYGQDFDSVEQSIAALSEVVQEVVASTTGRPTQ